MVLHAFDLVKKKMDPSKNTQEAAIMIDVSIGEFVVEGMMTPK